jgi:hypothetical protein
MYHSDLRKEIAYQQANLDYKRRKLAEALDNQAPFIHLKKMYEEINTIERKLQLCFEESKAQMEGQDESI